jgi:ribosomal protein L7/L12
MDAPDLTPEHLTPEQAQAKQRAIAMTDVYVALRLSGHSYLGSIKTLRILGVSLAEAKLVADTSDQQRLAMQQQMLLEDFTSPVAH